MLDHTTAAYTSTRDIIVIILAIYNFSHIRPVIYRLFMARRELSRTFAEI